MRTYPTNSVSSCDHFNDNNVFCLIFVAKWSHFWRKWVCLGKFYEWRYFAEIWSIHSHSIRIDLPFICEDVHVTPFCIVIFFSLFHVIPTESIHCCLRWSRFAFGSNYFWVIRACHFPNTKLFRISVFVLLHWAIRLFSHMQIFECGAWSMWKRINSHFRLYESFIIIICFFPL